MLGVAVMWTRVKENGNGICYRTTHGSAARGKQDAIAKLKSLREELIFVAGRCSETPGKSDTSDAIDDAT